MDKMQTFALQNPLATADGGDPGAFRIVRFPWSLILTVNK
jgi:hypothetical protein